MPALLLMLNLLLLLAEGLMMVEAGLCGRCIGDAGGVLAMAKEIAHEDSSAGRPGGPRQVPA